MPRRTDIDELYETLGTVITALTGREWWRKEGMNASPAYPYALIMLKEADGIENQVVENNPLDPIADTGERFEQVVWGTSLLDVEIDFYKSATNDSAQAAATRFRNGLMLTERFFDLWEIAGLSGGTRLMNISSLFREATEPRWQVRFQIYANITDPAPLDNTQIFDIDSTTVEVTHDGQDEIETILPDVEIINTED